MTGRERLGVLLTGCVLAGVGWLLIAAVLALG